MNRSTKDKVLLTQVLAPVAVTADVATSAADASKGESLTFLVNVGAFAFSETNKLTLTLQHSDVNEGTDFAAVASEDVFGGAASGVVAVLDATDDASKIFEVHYMGKKKFARLNIVEGGTVSVPMAVTAVQSALKAQPDA
jgi:hypothetical protein